MTPPSPLGWDGLPGGDGLSALGLPELLRLFLVQLEGLPVDGHPVYVPGVLQGHVFVFHVPEHAFRVPLQGVSPATATAGDQAHHVALPHLVGCDLHHPHGLLALLVDDGIVGGSLHPSIARAQRTRIQDYMKKVRDPFRAALKGDDLQVAFDELWPTWSSEMAAMIYADIMQVMDLILLTSTRDIL